jgi:rsbT co-antagonist protein RsbR
MASDEEALAARFTEGEPVPPNVEARIDEVFRVIAEVGSGDYSVRLPAELPEGDAFFRLFHRVNEMIAALAAQEQRNVDYQRELEDKLATIDQQRAAIRELSTPIMEVWEGILCLPVVGIMDSTRSADMTDALLRAVVATRARCTIIDITGIEAMDTSTADHFLRMAKAVQLLGAACVLTGLNPQIAQTLVHMDVALEGLITHRSLRDALQHFVGERRATRVR